MNFHMVTVLADRFGLDFSRMWCEKNCYPGYPPEMDLGEARERLGLLSDRIGERNFARVARVWESWLIEGIDY